MKKCSIATVAGLLAVTGAASAGDFPSGELLTDGSLETTIPGLLNPEGWIFSPGQFNVFGVNFPNLFSDGDGSTTVTPFDGFIAFELNRFVPNEWSETFLLEDLPDFFPFDTLPGAPVDPSDPDGPRMVEVTDSNGTRMVTYIGVPAGNPKLATARVPTTLFDGTEFDTSEPQFGFNDLPMSDRPAPGDELVMTYWHYISSDAEEAVQPDGAVSIGEMSFETGLFPEPEIAVAQVFADLTNDPRDTWVQYELRAVVPEGTRFIDVSAFYFPVAQEFLPLDEDADGIQDEVLIDGSFNGQIDPELLEDIPIPAFQFDDEDEPSVDSDGDGVNDAFTPFINLVDFGLESVTPTGSAFFDQFSLVNLGPADVGPTACNLADIAEPFETLNSADVTSFVGAFQAGDSAADIAAPFEVLNSADVTTFVNEFQAGCP